MSAVNDCYSYSDRNCLELFRALDGQNRAIVIAESLARVIAAIEITSVRWRSYLPPKRQKLVLTDPASVVLRFEAEWPARVDYVR